ncbi:MAG: arsenate reductase family protein [Verrucomicrobia bacterium]|nr:arsenate reductase family protein [Verrucomicrobiota bacterium]
MLKAYVYQGCSTCRNALKWLKSHHIEFHETPIRETPPTLSELQTMLKARGGEVRALFNTSGLDYRALGLKDTLPTMPQSESLKLLSQNGNLVKRPFALDEKTGVALNGFNESEWQAAFLNQKRPT